MVPTVPLPNPLRGLWYNHEVYNSRTPEYRKAYAAAHYKANKAKYLERNREYKRRIRLQINALKNRPCADCGVEYPAYVMDFDHRDQSQKKAIVSLLVLQVRLAEALEEIKKCDVVCANCHRERTFKQYSKKYPECGSVAALRPRNSAG